MIDIATESLIPLREAPRRLPPRPTGKRVHISACYRWVSRGVRGIRLEAIRVGGTMYTSLEALQRFADRLGPQVAREPQPIKPTTVTRYRQIDQASRRLREALGPAAEPSREADGAARSPEAKDKAVPKP